MILAYHGADCCTGDTGHQGVSLAALLCLRLLLVSSVGHHIWGVSFSSPPPVFYSFWLKYKIFLWGKGIIHNLYA
jgi:hypothetical protein